MVRCNLSVLLAERKLKISKVAVDTGISRTTLTALAHNYTQGIQFDTLNTLCSYLAVSPNQIVSWIPVDIKVEEIGVSKNLDSISLSLEICQNGRKTPCSLDGSMRLGFSNGALNDIDIELSLWDEEINAANVREENILLKRVFPQIQAPFLSDIEQKIFDELLDYRLKDYVGDSVDPIGFRVIWPTELRPQI